MKTENNINLINQYHRLENDFYDSIFTLFKRNRTLKRLQQFEQKYPHIKKLSNKMNNLGA